MLRPGELGTPSRALAQRVAVVYFFAAAAWIVFSDLALLRLDFDLGGIVGGSIAKGLLFCIVTAVTLYFALARILPPLARTPDMPLPASDERPFWRSGLAAVFGGMALLMIALAVGILILESRRQNAEVRNNLRAVLELKSQQLELWLQARRQVAGSYGGARALREQLARLESGMATAPRGELVTRLESIRTALSVDAILLLDASGELVTGAGEADLQRVSPAIAASARSAIAAGKPLPQVLHRDGAAAQEDVLIDFIVPMRDPSDGAVAGAFVLRERASREFFRIVQNWPTPSKSAEAFLVRRVGDDIVYLSELRFRTDAALQNRRGMDERMLSSSRALSNAGSLAVDLVDYRGVDVVVAARRIAATDWVLVVKIDRDEVLAPVRRSAAIWLAAILGITLLGALGVGALWRERRLLSEMRDRTHAADRRKAEDRLRASEERLRRYFDQGLVGMAITLPDKGFAEVNDKVCAMLGYSRAELMSLDWSRLTHPDDLAADVAQFERMKAGEIDGYSLDKRFVRQDGSILDATISVDCLRKPDRSIDYIVALLQDVSERKRAEAQLRETEERQRALLEQSIAGIYVIQDGRIAYVNPRMREIFGYGKEDAFDANPLVHVAPEERARVGAQLVERMRSDAAASYSIVSVRKDGTRFVLGISAHRVKFGGSFAIMAIAQDITEKEQLEAERLARTARIDAQLKALNAVSMSPNLIAGNVDAFAREVTEAAAAATGVERANAWRFNDTESELHCIDLFEATPARHSAGAVLREDQFGPEFTALKQAAYVDANEPLTDARTAGYAESYLKPLRITSMLDAVVRYSGRNLGLLCLEHVDRAHRWHTDEIGFVCQLADKLALAITNRKLRTSRDLLQSVIEHTPVRVFWKDRDLRYLGCNSSFARDAGYEQPADLIGKDDFQMAWRAQAELYRADDRQVLDSDTPKLGFEEPGFSAEGRKIWLRTSKAPLHDRSGGVIGVLGIYEDVTRRKRADEELKRLGWALHALSQSNSSLVHARTEAELFARCCEGITGAEGYPLAWIGMAGPEPARRVDVVASAGAALPYLNGIRVTWGDSPEGDGPTGRVIRSGKTQIINDFAAEPSFAPWRAKASAHGLAGSISLPIRLEGAVIGALMVYAREANAFGEAEVKLFDELAGDLSYGITTRRMRVAFEKSVADREHGAVKLRASLEASIQAIAATVEARDPYTAGHEKRVAELAAAIAREMGMADFIVEGIHFGGLIHDLGKIQVPAEILSKPTRLMPVEYELIKGHSQAGYDILKGIDFPWPIAQMVLQHHERLDGSGYPNGLKGDQILPEARVLAVADTVEAMSSHRPYRAGLGIDKALAEIERGRGGLYDEKVVDACLRLFREKAYAIPA